MQHCAHLDRIPESLRRRLEDRGLLEAVSFCFSVSNYIATRLISHPQWIEEIFLHEGYKRGLGPLDYRRLFRDLSLAQVKELFRKEHIRLGVRDLLRAADIERILRELSFLADAVIGRCLEMAVGELNQGEGVECCVISLGKLGGEELNYYSDVDLMYVYRGSSEDLELYSKIFSRLNRMLSGYQEGEPVYHVDLRLRPQGRSGLLCMPVEAYEAYYEAYGRTWERAMLIRARCTAGSRSLFEDFWKRVAPFVYRKYMDFSAIDEVRRLKDQIDATSKDEEDIKTGKGGIREIEFIVQAFQLVFGGKNPWLRVGNLFRALDRLKASGLLGSEDYSLLSQAYRFYRRLENRIQMLDCTRTQRLPQHSIHKISIAMGYKAPEDFMKDLNEYRRAVRLIFERVMEPSGGKTYVIGGEDPSLIRLINHISSNCGRESEEALRKVMEDAQEAVNPSMVVRCLADVLEAMGYGRCTFLDLLLSSDGFRKFVVAALGGSQYIARVIVSQPDLLYELLEGDGSFPSKKELVEDLIDRIDKRGVSQAVDGFVKERLVKIGFMEIAGKFNIFRVFSEHTRTAEAFLEALHRTVSRKSPIAVVGLGKLGSRELTYHSDLDLLFVSDVSGDDIHRDYYMGIINNGAYRVDVRLRPFGSKGVMVSTPEALRLYFEKHGRVWERLAYARARVVVSDDEGLSAQITNIIREFVYGPVPDNFEDEVYSMRLRLEREFGSSPYNIKYSEGGLVDVEFVAQYLAIKYRIERLHPLAVLLEAMRRGVLDEKSGLEAKEGYVFLRRLENIMRLVFYPPLKEVPRQGEKLFMAARSMKMDEYQLLDRYMEVKRSNRQLLRRVLNME